MDWNSWTWCRIFDSLSIIMDIIREIENEVRKRFAGEGEPRMPIICELCYLDLEHENC